MPGNLDGSCAPCGACGPIPAATSALWKGGQLQRHDIPPEQAQLEIVGAPYFHDREEGSRNRCLKRCPACGTYFLWKLDYEYLVNGGTEDEVTLERLDPAEGEALAARMLAEREAAEAGFRASAAPLQGDLAGGPSRPRFGEAIALVDRAQGRGIDVTAALPAIARALVDLAGGDDAGPSGAASAARYELATVLSRHCELGAGASATVVELLDAAAPQPGAVAPEVADLRAWATSFRDLVPFGFMRCRGEVAALLDALERAGAERTPRRRSTRSVDPKLPAKRGVAGRSTAELAKEVSKSVPSATEQSVDTLLWILVRLGRVKVEKGAFRLTEAGLAWVAKLCEAGFFPAPTAKRARRT